MKKVTRRGFLKLTGGAVAGGIVLGSSTALALRRLQRRVHPREGHGQFAGRLHGDDEAQPMRQSPEVTRRGRFVSQRDQGVLHDGMLHEMNRHALELYTHAIESCPCVQV